jgi:hypothetical protein
VPLWLVGGLLAATALVLAARHGDLAAREVATIDPLRATLALEREAGELDPRWSEWLAKAVARVEPFKATDRAGARAVEEALAGLAFVAEVEPARVVWPDGLELRVRLRRPVACVRVGQGFLAVAEDATVLPGAFPVPPWVEDGWLPVIGPNDPANAVLLPGDVLDGEHELDALSVAISMRANLSGDVFDVLGPPLVDARRAREASVEDPGVVLELEGRRIVRFGRAPWSDAPGELPAELKWRALARAARELRDGERDWDAIDVRWDVPDIHWREAPARPAHVEAEGD